MADDPDVPVPEMTAENTDPLDLPIGCTISPDDVILLPDGTQFGLCITGGRDLVEDYIETVAPEGTVPPPPGG